jgi:N-acetylmuramoyl-L-alanine amidase
MRVNSRMCFAVSLSVLAAGAPVGSASASVKHPSWHQAGPMPDPAAPPVAVAVDARASEAGGVTRLVFDLTAKVAVKAVLTERPDRLIVDLAQVNFQLDPAARRLDPKGVGLIRSFRFGLFAPGKSRIVIDLTGPAALRGAEVASIAGGDPSRLTIELVRTDRAAFHAAVHRPPPPTEAARTASPVDPSTVGSIGTAPPAAQSDPRPVVVIDPGHGGIDPGASGVLGAVEKTVVLDFASALASKLSAGDRYRVVMTRRDDSFVSLADRVRVARDTDAALFISVHADTLSDASVSGATIYTASDRASDAEAARVAAAENQADEAAGLDPTPAPPEVSDILFDLTRRETRAYAHQFQRTLTGYWSKIARLNRNPERAAGFKVLQAPDVPSVLLELGYLSSDKDARMLISPEWRAKATDTVASAVDRFFAARSASPSPGLGPAALR